MYIQVPQISIINIVCLLYQKLLKQGWIDTLFTAVLMLSAVIILVESVRNWRKPRLAGGKVVVT